ncbi:MAG: hypothetical protein LKG27_06830 [Clostridiaceae bacterium]|nr:hypothetical protein [Clostridiaceae bacterium]
MVSINKGLLFVQNINAYNFSESFDVVKKYFKTENLKDIIDHVDKSACDIVCLTFNVADAIEVSKACNILKNTLPLVTKPLMIRGCGNDEIDKLLIPELIKLLDRQSIVATVNENNYKEIVPLTAKAGHTISIRTPIDINLAKEMNILTSELGQSLDKILIDSDIGGLGYGLDYGYSMIEKIKIEAQNDKYLNMPIISFAGEESLKTKEAKSNEMSGSWGNLETRAELFEISAVTSAIAAGSDIVVVNNPKVINVFERVSK